MKLKQLSLALLLSSTLTTSIALATPTIGNTFKVVFGYGTYNVTLTADENIKALSFNSGDSQLESAFKSWDKINPQNANFTVTKLTAGLYHYNITPKSGSDFGTSTITLSQLPLINGTAPVKNMPFSQYNGLMQNISINGQAASYSDHCSGSACNDPAPGKLLGGYFTDWSTYDGHGDYTPAALPLTNINTLFYAFGGVDATRNTALMFDPNADVLSAHGNNTNSIPYLALMRAKYPYLNVIYSFGGWGSISNNNFQSGDLSVLFTYYPDKIASVAQSMVSGMAKSGFNGIDIDYEWESPFETNPAMLGGHAPLCQPASSGDACNPLPLSSAEAQGYAALLTDIRSDLDLLTKETGQHYLLATALPAGGDKLNTLAKYTYQGKSVFNIMMNTVDYMSLMAYDLHGAFDAGATPPNNISNFQSRFAPDPNDPTTDPNIKGYNITDVVNVVKSLMQAKGVPAADIKKVVVGVAAYSRTVKLAATPSNPTPAQAEGIYNTLAPSSQQAVGDAYGEYQGDYLVQTKTGHAGPLVGSTIYDYKCIVDTNNCYYIDNPGSSRIPTDMAFHSMAALPQNANQPGFYAATPWGFSHGSRLFMSFDNNLSAANKAKYVKANGLGGVMIWELDGDLSPTDKNYQKESIVYALYNALK